MKNNNFDSNINIIINLRNNEYLLSFICFINADIIVENIAFKYIFKNWYRLS